LSPLADLSPDGALRLVEVSAFLTMDAHCVRAYNRSLPLGSKFRFACRTPESLIFARNLELPMMHFRMFAVPRHAR